MATTKYIVDNVANQTITGDLTINGSITITGQSNGIATYKALLTQTGSITGTSLTKDFNNGLIIGETYTIGFYGNGDDFSNIANVQSGIINTSGCTFIATGETPSVYSGDTELISGGELIVNVLENNLGYDIEWFYEPGRLGLNGIYVGFNANTGAIYNSFNRNTTYVNVGPLINPSPYYIFGGVALDFGQVKDLAFFIGVFDTVNSQPVNDALYYQPFELRVKQDTDTTPIQTYGLNVSTLPYNNVSVIIYAGSNLIQEFYGDSTTVNNINELVNQLNTNSDTNFLGTYSVNDGVENGIILTMATNLKNQFSPNNTLTFEVFSYQA
jgi:hypothetical protein